MTHRDSTREDIQTQMKSRRAHLHTQVIPSAAVMSPWNAFLTNVDFRPINRHCVPLDAWSPCSSPANRWERLIKTFTLRTWVGEMLCTSGCSSWWGIKELPLFWHSCFSQRGRRKWHNCIEATQPQWQQGSLKNWVDVLTESIRATFYFRHHSLETDQLWKIILPCLFPLLRKIYTSP